MITIKFLVDFYFDLSLYDKNQACAINQEDSRG